MYDEWIDTLHLHFLLCSKYHRLDYIQDDDVTDLDYLSGQSFACSANYHHLGNYIFSSLRSINFFSAR